jgi:hypothetical protein
VCALVLAGCASSTAYRVTRADTIGPCGTTVPDRDVLVGVALSGGGSLAALFGATAMEALAGVRTADGASVIEKISHLSSVSGGSIAATYEDRRRRNVLACGGRRALRKSGSGILDSPLPEAAPAQAGQEGRLLRRSVPFSLLTFDFSRIPFFGSLQTEGVFPDAKTITGINLRHTDAKWAADMSDLPPARKAEATPLATPQEVTERIAEIPTRLVLTSECDRQLLAAAAAKLVDANRAAILEFLDRP